MTQNSELRAIARQKLEGNWGTAALITFVSLLIQSVLNQTGIGWLANLPIAFGTTIAFLNLLRGGKFEVSVIFEYFNGRVFVTMLLKCVYILLWSLLLIIPGIIKNYSYAMTEFLMIDNPEMENNAAIEKSMEMMQGNKMKLFMLDLSFIGWFILCMLTFGLGFILLAPYVETAHAAFYEDLKAEQMPA